MSSPMAYVLIYIQVFLMDRSKIHELAQNFKLLSISLLFSLLIPLFDRHPFEAFVLVVTGIIVL